MKIITLLFFFGERRSHSVHMFIKTEDHTPKPEEQSMRSTLYYIEKRMITYSSSNSFCFAADPWVSSLGRLTGGSRGF